MDWRLPAALVGVVALLLGAQALVAQVKHDVNGSLDTKIEDTPFDPLDDPKSFSLRNLKVPQNLDVTLPEGTKIDPDFGDINLEDAMDVKLPPGTKLPEFDMSIPPGTEFKIPEGAQFDGEFLHLPDGLQATLPDGTKLDLPPGSTLKLPPDLARSLMEQGLPRGTLPSDFLARMPQLPGGQSLTVIPPFLPEGGTLHLPPGTNIDLPPGYDGTLPEGVLPQDLPFTLPPGTNLRFPPVDPDQNISPITTGGGGGGSSPPTTPPPPPPPSGDAISTTTDIDAYDETAKKGEPFHVSGHVARVSGTPVAGASVDLYLNETKETPGAHVGGATTDAAGQFSALVSLPEDKPAGTYQLVARANGFVDASGNRYRESWSDPPVHVTSATKILLTREADAIHARLVDVAGLAVAGAKLALVVDGAETERLLTDSTGTVRFRVPAEGADVRARFDGSFDHEPSEARLVSAGEARANEWTRAQNTITFTSPTSIDVSAPAVVPVKNAVRVSGSLYDAGKIGIRDTRVYLAVNGQSQGFTTTDATGGFSFTLFFTTPSQNSLVFTFPGDSTYGSSQATARVTATTRAVDVQPLVVADRNSALRLTGRVLDDGQGVNAATVTLTGLGPSLSTTTGPTGAFTFQPALTPSTPLGDVSLVYYSGLVNASQTLRVTVRGTLSIEAPERGTTDKSVGMTATLADTQGVGISNVKLTGTVAGPSGSRVVSATTDATGSAVVVVNSQGVAGDYTLTLAPVRESYVTASAAQATTHFGRFSVAWADALPFPRGETARVVATLTYDGAPLSGELATLVLFNTATATTDDFGRATFNVDLSPSATLGPATAFLSVPSFARTQEQTFRIVARTTLSLEGPDDFRPGEVLSFNATLVDNLGAPISGSSIQVNALPDPALGAGGTWNVAGAGATGPDGRSQVLLSSEGSPGTLLVATATYAGEGHYLPSSAETQVAPRALPPLPVGLPLPALKTVAYGAGGVSLAGVALAGVFYWRKRRVERPEQALAGAAAVATTPRAPQGPSLLVDFPGIDPDLPPVWGMGEPLAVSVTAPPGFASLATCRLRAPATEVPLTLHDGTGVHELAPLPLGEHVLAATPETGGLGAGEATIRIVEYPKEIANEFERFVERARARAPSLGKHATAREIEWTLVPELGASSEGPLQEIALVMEVANYSEQRVGRVEYVRFVRALRLVEPLLAPPPSVPAPPEEGTALG